jgi:predicted metal-dependent hydrolase
MRLRRAPIDSLTIDDLTFAVRWSTRRRTVGITVTRDGDLQVAAPSGTSARRLETMVRAKLPWVRRKLAEFVALGPPAEPRRFAEGESLPYLGRLHRLVLVDLGSAPVALRHGRFELSRSLDGQARAAMVAWYTARARARIEDRIAHFAPLVGAAPAGLVVRDLGRRRWGVCHCGTRIVTFHWELVMQPPHIVDYVVVHELAHLLVPNHGPGFWQQVERVLPDWKARRRWLALHGRRHAL